MNNKKSVIEKIKVNLYKIVSKNIARQLLENSLLGNIEIFNKKIIST